MLCAQNPQTTWELKTDESSATKNYVARESIKLQSNGTAGFHFQATTGKSFSAKIDAGLLFPPTDKTYVFSDGSKSSNPVKTINAVQENGSVVGSIPGSASVTPTGAGTYQIPIEVPAGINGMQPSISLAYNSQGGFGALGTGWDVAGCSAITRGSKNIYFDGPDNSNIPIKFDNTDALYLDGQRLIKLSGNNLEAGATYATEVENYSKVTILSNTDNSIYFQVIAVDGKVMEYGKTDDSKQKSTNNTTDNTRVLRWNLDNVTDKNGNAINYKYEQVIIRPAYTIPEHTGSVWVDGHQGTACDDFGNCWSTWIEGQYVQTLIPEEYVPAYGIQLSLHTIEYANQTIEFKYGYTLEHAKNNYINDFATAQTSLLDEIIIYSGTTKLRSYGFNYISNSDSRLSEVNLMAGDNTKLKSTTINWGADINNIQFNKIGTITDTGLSSQPEGVSSNDYADIDGDGHLDRIERWIGNPGHIKIYFYDSVNKTFSNAQTATLSIPFGDYDTYHQQVIYADINNDGKAEIIYTDQNKLYAYKYLAFGQDGGYSFSQCFTAGTSNYIFDYYDKKVVKIVSADVNHDGYADIVMAFYNKGGNLTANGRRGYAIFFGSKDGLYPIPIYHYVNPNYSLQHLEVGDFNADGKLDIVCLPSNKTIFEANVDNETLFDDPYISLVTDRTWNINDMSGTNDQVLDINGDGLSDLIALCPSNNVWRSSRNTGGTFNQPTLKNEPFSGPNVHFIDINGDGLVDAINYTNNYDYTEVSNPNYDGYNPWEPEFNYIQYYVNTTWSIYLNTGNGNFASPIISTSNNAETKEPSLITISDINGDGITDFIFTQGVNMYALMLPNSNRRNLVSSITNGMNQTESFTYKNFSKYDAYSTTEATAKVRPLRAPILLVDTYMQPDGNVTSYDYTSPKYHTEGKGFLGFTTVTATNTQKNAKVTSNYAINQTYFFPVLASQHISTATGTDNISVSSQTNDVKVIDATNKRYIPIVTAQSSTDVLKGITQTGTTDYKDYPGKLTQTTTVGDLITTTTVTTFTGPSGKTPFLPATVITTRTQDGKSFTRETDYTYTYDTDNPYKIIGKTETNDPGDPNSVVTTFSNYDSWGHPQSVAVAANGITRSSSVKYYKNNTTETNAGLFLRSKTNVLLETTSYNWNETTGLLDSETDPRGHNTTYSYDSFGQSKETVYPDGNRKASVLQWAGTGGVTGAVYYSYSQVSGSAPVTTWYDALGREIQSDTYGLNNKKISVSTEYYTTNDFTAGKRIGMVYRVSEPYFEADAANKTWAKTYTYDEFGLPKKVVSPMGEVSTVFNKLVTTVTTPEGTTVTTQNSAGQTITSNVNGKTVTYDYYASGLAKSSTPEGGQAISMVYNLQGKQIKLNDPDGGFTRSEYNGFGEQTLGVQRVHLTGDSIKTTHVYKTDGRLESINRNGEITTYTYDSSIKGRINVIELKNKNNTVQNRQTFTYDPTNITDRVTNVKEEIGSGDLQSPTLKEFNTGKTYDALGRVKKEIYPSGYYTVNTYDGYGNLTETKDEYNRSIWKANAENARGQLTSVNKGTKTSTYDYWDNGLTKEIKADGVVDMYYEYESLSHNLHLREDKVTSQTETMGYDGFNRLTSWTVTRNGADTPYSMSYDPTTSNITGKSDLGNASGKGDFDYSILTYGGKRADGSPIGPHALATISLAPDNFPTADLNVTYTDFKKIATLSEGTKFYRLTYGTDDERRKSEYYANGVGQGTATLTRYQVGSYEEEIDKDNKVRKIHYLSGAILIQHDGMADSLLYTYSDAQGSLIVLTDANGSLLTKTIGGTVTEIGRFAYDPWGARRKADNWNVKESSISFIINRGYTGHEHIDAFGIINMNGRVYDPTTGMFLSPDPTLTDAGNWLDYNRYSYCLNNPFKYTDPSGYTWWAENWQPVVTTVASIAAGALVVLSCGTATPVIATGMMAGAAGGFAGGFVGTAAYGGNLSQCLGAGLQGAVIGGISGAITAGIGAQFGAVGTFASGKFDVINELERAGAHALAQGTFSAIRGGNFWQGAAAGFVGSLGGTASGALGITDFFGTVAVTSAMGGVGAVIGGARHTEDILFGMAAGAMVGALNFAEDHGAEKVDASKIKTIISKKEVQINNKDPYTLRAALKHPDQVAKIARERYTNSTGLKLDISTESLQNEIMYHAIAYKMYILRSHTDIADCGESSVDTNRWFWNFFSK
jgi:RHS repeat-associated protein